jgi:hypothetical protein
VSPVAATVRGMSSGVQLPEDCPPNGHLPAEGTFYRLTRGDLAEGSAPGSGDWVLPLNTRKSEAYQQYDMCQAYSYSMFADLRVLLEARESVPFVRKKSISRVELQPAMGRILETESWIGPSHHDWWPSEGNLVPPAEVVEGRAS